MRVEIVGGARIHTAEMSKQSYRFVQSVKVTILSLIMLQVGVSPSPVHRRSTGSRCSESSSTGTLLTRTSLPQLEATE